jgi:hypothetical protein
MAVTDLSIVIVCFAVMVNTVSLVIAHRAIRRLAEAVDSLAETVDQSARPRGYTGPGKGF